jgi:hypothetical protein
MSKEYECKECVKKYASYNNLWIHNKKYHKEGQHIDNKSTNFLCNYCKRAFSTKFTAKRHELKCNYKELTTQPTTNISNSNIDKELEIINARNKELELKITLEKLLMEKCKMHPKTFSALNRILINNSINTNSNNIINNNHYYNIVGFGYENLINVLTPNEKKQIMKSRFCCLEEIIKIAHCSNYKQFKNIIITNLKDNIAYKYDNTLKYFISIDKNELINELIDNRVCDIGEIYDELIENNKLDETTVRLIKEFIEKINSNSEYKIQQNHNLRILLYNNKDKIITDIGTLIDNK